MKLEPLNIENKLVGNYFYFAADEIYFNLYGKALILSLQDRAPWAGIHVHFYNQTEEQKDWCKLKNISSSNDIIDRNNLEFRTLCACIRFIRIPEIFDQNSKIMAFDCDVIAKNVIPEEKFLEDTDKSKVTLRKGNRSLASAISFGNDNARNILRDKLLQNFEMDNIYWFLDQDIMDQMLSEKSLFPMTTEWTGTKMTDRQMIWTAKGQRKNSKGQYQELINYYLQKDNEKFNSSNLR